MRIGLHASISAGLENAAKSAAALGANCLQIFSSSPRMWRASVPKPEDIAKLRAARAAFDITPLVIHTGYLINLASVDPDIRLKSIEAFRGELERATAIGADYLVLHPGNYKGQELERGMAGFVTGVAQAASGAEYPGVTLLLENTVGNGCQIGSTFPELRALRDHIQCIETGYCLDTCHLLAAGFDVAQPAGLKAAMMEADRILGLEHVCVIHANDSKGGLGSRLDRHANIGDGKIGLAGFRGIVRHPKLRQKPFILETPDDREDDRRRDVEHLKSMARK